MNDPIIKINTKRTTDNSLTFTLANVDVSIANGIRRTILTDIPVIGFDKETAVIEKNTSQFINEIIKHRLTCIPIMLDHYHDENLEDILPKQYSMELDIDNTTNEERLVTTGDMILINKETGAKVSQTELNKIFPKNHITGDHITFLRLRPQFSETIPGQAIKMKCGFGVFTAKQDSVYIPVSKCTYFNTVDEKEAKLAWENKRVEFLKQFDASGDSSAVGKKNTKKDIAEEEKNEKRNFDALERYRHFKNNSFDFTIKSVSFYNETQLVNKACTVLIERIKNFIDNILRIDESDSENEDNKHVMGGVQIVLSHEAPKYPSTMENSFDIIIQNEDYTLGNILQHYVYDLFYMGEKNVIYVGFQKFHPHDTESVLRIAFIKPTTHDIVVDNLKTASLKAIDVLRKIQKSMMAK
jgi:DNA-directed RNA polymerase subunit L